MIYKPHSLYKKVIHQSVDEFGRPITPTHEWAFVCPCRCDDNNTKEFKSSNGEVFRPSYRIICEGIVSINPGDEVKAMCEEIRGEGKVFNVKRLNFLNYTEVWV